MGPAVSWKYGDAKTSPTRVNGKFLRCKRDAADDGMCVRVRVCVGCVVQKLCSSRVPTRGNSIFVALFVEEERYLRLTLSRCRAQAVLNFKSLLISMRSSTSYQNGRNDQLIILDVWIFYRCETFCIFRNLNEILRKTHK